MDLSRRELMGAGAAAAATAVVASVASLPPPAAAGPARSGGVHVYALLRVVAPDALRDFPYSVMLALWGADDSLHGIGWGATTEGGDAAESYAGSGVVPCVFAAHGSIAGDSVRLDATQIYSGHRVDQGTRWVVEASLTTGFVHAVETMAGSGTEFVLEGTGTAVRI